MASIGVCLEKARDCGYSGPTSAVGLDAGSAVQAFASLFTVLDESHKVFGDTPEARAREVHPCLYFFFNKKHSYNYLNCYYYFLFIPMDIFEFN